MNEWGQWGKSESIQRAAGIPARHVADADRHRSSRRRGAGGGGEGEVVDDDRRVHRRGHEDNFGQRGGGHGHGENGSKARTAERARRLVGQGYLAVCYSVRGQGGSEGLSFHLGARCCEGLCASIGSSAPPLVFCFGFLPFSWPSFLVLLVLPDISFYVINQQSGG